MTNEQFDNLKNGDKIRKVGSTVVRVVAVMASGVKVAYADRGKSVTVHTGNLNTYELLMSKASAILVRDSKRADNKGDSGS